METRKYNAPSVNKHVENSVCTLPEPKLANRVAVLQETIFSKTQKIFSFEDGYEYVFDEEPELIDDLVEFINYERNCCPSFNFALLFDSNNGPVRLRIYGSGYIKGFLTSLIANSELKKKVVEEV